MFGSAARRQEDVDSDVDLMVDLDESADLFSLVRLERDLRDLLGVDVDVVPRSAMGDDLRRAAETDSVPV
ncbi:MAG: nucleotidyltransferase domain-containing protein [Euzebyales bacterium]|nr:nucleotidyltransferase domain-containing protein [Euzebyales bacterium]